MSAAQLIETSEEDSSLAVARFIGDLLNDGEANTALAETPGSRFNGECEALLREERYGELMDKFAQNLDLVLGSKATSDQDAECCLNITCHLVPRIPQQQGLAAAKRLSAALAAQTDSKPEKRLAALVNLYNVVSDPEPKLAVLLEALSFAKRAGLADLLLPVIRAHAESWPRDLRLPAARERELYQACAEVLQACTRKPKTAAKEAYKLLTKCLGTYEGTNASDLATAKPVAAAVASDFIRSPEMFQFDLLDNPAVKALAGDAQHGALYQLLSIFLSGTVQDFERFAAGNEQLFAAVGLPREAALAKMRLLALMGLAHGADEEQLGVPASEVEALVVQAIGKRIVEARIDQLRGTVAVAKCVPRTFGASQWRELQGQLAVWKESVDRVKQMTADHSHAQALPHGLNAAPIRA
ncbi:hypothetical protein N2152v2_005157 [Parachlorella kessleri]